jgi:hypothetical protein
MKQRLSHSQINKYSDCPKSYELHYKKKWRVKEQSAALLFGTAIDKACETYLHNRDVVEAHETFLTYWKQQDLNGKPTELHNCTEIVYSNNDLDLDLLYQSNYDLIIKSYSIKDVLATIEDILQRKDKVGFKKLSENDKQIFNFINWLCMREKGRLMLIAAIKWIDDNIVELLGTQVKVDLENEDGDGILGYADLVARVKGKDKPVIIDFKTSGRAYEEDSVRTSTQLALYVFSLKHKYENTNTAGYVVFQKNIRKNKEKTCSVCGYDGTGGRHKKCDNIVKGNRCNGEWIEKLNPSAVVQTVFDNIDEFFQKQVVENYNEVNRGIKAEVFPRNWKSCIQYNGVVTCPYYNYCHHDKIDDIITAETK